MTPVDCRPDYPVNALLVGGPMHGKRLNLELGAQTYTCIEGNSSAAFVPTQRGYNETLYHSWQRLGDITLFVHETCRLKDIHRAPEDARQARLRAAEVEKKAKEREIKLRDDISEKYDKIAALHKEVNELRESVTGLQARVGSGKALLESALTTLAFADAFLAGKDDA